MVATQYEQWVVCGEIDTAFRTTGAYECFGDFALFVPIITGVTVPE